MAQVRIPDEVATLLGEDRDRGTLELVLAQLVHEGRVSLGFAGERLGLDRWGAIEWYRARGYPYPDPPLTSADVASEPHLSDI
jgi:hypothetical protein